MATRNYATDYVVHADYSLGAQCNRGRAHDGVWSRVRLDVTCKRCLASLAKRDREFQRKARATFGANRTAASWRGRLALVVLAALLASDGAVGVPSPQPPK